MPSKLHPTKAVIVHIDGGSRGNPGPAAFAVVVNDAQGSPLDSFSKCLGRATNNVAEYQALLAALNYALERQYLHLKVVSDSELLTRQVTGQYKVKNRALKVLHEQARALIAHFDSFRIEHVLRKHNREADRLVNQALDGAENRRKATDAGALKPLRASATYHQGVLKLIDSVPPADGEEADLDMERKG